ncbi:MAG: thiopurine S-methyltransferase [Gammaproteobacteria bacterium]|nr:thiopurine S-methyltransferase [Bathymodiolus septemdierum thioautotrophic gill symbiont]RUA04478.1 MAG: thiopurine S-methyltransferase [Gammaproteobacteria bacterium]
MTDWIQRWKDGETGWHKDTPNDKLVKFIDCLQLERAATVLVPLCGKSQDMVYLLEQGYKVIGVELSEVAVTAFFQENAMPYTVQEANNFTVYNARNIRIFCGDFFNLDSGHLGMTSALYDRGALIALPEDLRVKYAQHLYDIIPSGCRILLLTLNYPQSQISGPPFAVDEAEVKSLFEWFECQQLECFNDIKNEPKYLHAGVDFIERATYCLHKEE